MSMTEAQAVEWLKARYVRVEFPGSRGRYAISFYEDACTENCGGHAHSYDWKERAHGETLEAAVAVAVAAWEKRR